jgi:hypothetical protein
MQLVSAPYAFAAAYASNAVNLINGSGNNLMYSSANTVIVPGAFNAGPTTVTGSETVTGPETVAGSLSVTNLNAGSATVTNQLTAGSATVNNNLTAGSATVNNQLKAGSITTSGNIQVGTAGLAVAADNTAPQTAPLRIVQGIVVPSGGGSAVSGFGFSVSKITTGEYTITFTKPFSSTMVTVTATALVGYITDTNSYVVTCQLNTSSAISLYITKGNVTVDEPFMFMAIGSN